MKFKRFEEMPVWQDARKLTTLIYTFTREQPFCKDFGLSGQIQRSAVSVMSNITEGYERTSTKEFLHFLSISKSSVGEVRCQLYVALDLDYIDQGEFNKAYNLCLSIASQITNFSKYLAETKLK